MNEEEKKAVEFVKKRTKELKKYAKRENELVYDDIILNLINKLQKENEELKERIREHTLLISPYYVKENYIPIQKIKDKIEEENLPLVIVGGRRNKRTLEYGIKLGRRQALQELLGSEE